MISYKCPVCAFSFNESDKAWDDAVAHGACPKCDAQLINFRAPLKISDQARKPRQDIRATYFIESNYKNRFLKLWMLRLMGFISGAILGLATLVFLLMAFNELTDSRYTPRGAGWLFIPIGLGFAMASYAPLLWLKIEKSIAKSITSYSKQIRLVLAAVILWISSVGIYVYLFEPYGYITSIDRVHLVKVIIFPIAICFVGLFIYKMILKKTK